MKNNTTNCDCEANVEMRLSDRVLEIPEALSIYFNNLVYCMKRQGLSVSVLSLGEAYFDVPRFELSEDDFAKGYHYSESRGLPELRSALSSYYSNRYQAIVDPEKEIIISAGSKPLIHMAFQAVLNPGDEVLIHEPAWLSYPEEIKLAGGIPRFMSYLSAIDDFPQFFSDKTKMIVINNPNNPSGKIYSRTELERLYEICRPRGIFILVDEAYSDFVPNSEFTSMAAVVPNKSGVIIVNSLSKNLGISGWRIGYAIADEKTSYAILKLNQHLITCAPTILQLYLAKNFNEIMSVTLPQAYDAVKKRQEVEEYMREIGLNSLPGSATFYIFVSIGDYPQSSLEFSLHLLMKYRISVVPGSAYGESTERFVRIGVGAIPIDELKSALDTIAYVLQNKEYDRAMIDNSLDNYGLGRFGE